MEEVDKITLDNLTLLGCDFSDEDVTSLTDLTAPMIVDATARCLEAITQSEEGSYPRHLPPAMSARFKVGQTLATTVMELGFKGELGYQTFLYPNARDTRNLLMFLVERLPRDQAQTTEEVLTSGALLNRVIADSVKQSLQVPWLPSYCKIDGLRKQGKAFSVESSTGMQRFTSQALFVPWNCKVEEKAMNAAFYENMPALDEQIRSPRVLACSLLEQSVRLLEEEQRAASKLKAKSSSSTLEKLVAKSIASSVKVAQTAVQKAGQRPSLPPKPGRKSDQSSISQEKDEHPAESKEERRARMEEELEKFRDELLKESELHKRLTSQLDELSASNTTCEADLAEITSRAEPRRKELELKTKTQSLLPEAPENIARLEEQVEKKRQQLVSLSAKWEEHREPLLAELRELRELARSRTSLTEKLETQLEEDRVAVEECAVEIKANDQKGKELQKRLAGIKKGLQTRAEYTRRILDITENNRKQKVEIARVIGEIVDLQREINMLRGKLDRTYAVTDELVFRDAKTDDSVRKMYKMLAGLHDHCRQLMEVIEEKGRLIREIRELEEQHELEGRKKNDENLNKIVKDFEEMKAANKKLKSLIQNNSN